MKTNIQVLHSVYKKISISLLILLMFVTGCRFSPDSNKEEIKTVTLKINFTDITARSVLPNLVLNNFVLTGTRQGDGSFSKSTDTQQEMMTGTIEIQTGNWTFTMTADITSGGSSTAAHFSDTIEVDVESGDTTLIFDLKPVNASGNEIETGDFEIAVSLEQSSFSSLETDASKYKAVATLYEDDETTEVQKTTYQTKTNVSSINFQKQNLDPGTYYFIIRYYIKNENNQESELNYFKACTRIAEGLKSSATVQNINLNNIYHINYAGGAGSSPAGGVTAIQTYSRHSPQITLVEYEKTGSHFMGWYFVESPDYATEPQTVLNPGVTAHDVTYYALWASGEIYVDKNGTGKGYYPTSPVNSLEKAFTSINKVHTRYPSSELDDYTITVSNEEYSENLDFTADPAHPESNYNKIHAGNIILQGTASASGTTTTVAKVGNINLDMPGTLTLRNIQTGSLIVAADKTVKLENGSAVHDAELNGNMSIEGSAVITNGLTFNDGSLITLTGNLTSETAATITISPDTYYANDYRILAENNAYNAANCGKFAIEPNHTDTSWKITETGVLYEEINQDISITYYENESDINVSSTRTENTVTFTAPGGYSDYVWTVDRRAPSGNNSYPGITISSDGKTLTLNMENWTNGKYDIMLTAQKTVTVGSQSEERVYSYHAQVTK